MSGFNYFILSNKVYFKQYFIYEKTYAQSVELVTRVQSTEGYADDALIIFVGFPSAGNGTPELSEFDVTGNTNIYGSWAYPDYLRRYLNFTQPVHWAQFATYKSKPEVAAILAEMPEYPDEGSIALIGDYIYVKFEFNP